jgi:hypothetical protein
MAAIRKFWTVYTWHNISGALCVHFPSVLVSRAVIASCFYQWATDLSVSSEKLLKPVSIHVYLCEFNSESCACNNMHICLLHTIYQISLASLQYSLIIAIKRKEIGNSTVLLFHILQEIYRGRHSSVGIANGSGQDGQGSISGRGKRFFFASSTHTGFGAHLASYKIGTGSCLPGGKLGGGGVWSLLLTCIYCWGKEWWSYILSLPYDFMASCWIKQKEIFAFSLLHRNLK